MAGAPASEAGALVRFVDGSHAWTNPEAPVPPMPILRSFRLAAAALLALCAACVPAARGPGAAPAPASLPGPAPTRDAAALAQALVRRVNEARSEQGLTPLRGDRALTVAAREQARTLALTLQADARTLFERLGPARRRFQGWGESVASVDEDQSVLPRRVVRRWMSAPDARDLLLNPDFALVGVGTVRGDDGMWHVVVVYASPRTVGQIEGFPEPP